MSSTVIGNTGINDREEWRNRILRALSELREGDQRLVANTREANDESSAEGAAFDH